MILFVQMLAGGLLPYEADLLGVKKNGIVTEVEIKRSYEDFKKDFEKDHKHDASIITYFYYCVPESILDKCIDYMLKHYNVEVSDDNYSKNLPAVLYYTEDAGIRRAYEKICSSITYCYLCYSDCLCKLFRALRKEEQECLTGQNSIFFSLRKRFLMLR